jgi:hypothetical protein
MEAQNKCKPIMMMPLFSNPDGGVLVLEDDLVILVHINTFYNLCTLQKSQISASAQPYGLNLRG